MNPERTEQAATAAAGHDQDPESSVFRKVPPPKGMERVRKTLYARLQLISLVGLVVIVEIVGRMDIMRVVVPFSDIIREMYTLFEGGLLGQVAISMRAFAFGYGLVLVLGIATAIGTYFSPTFSDVIRPYINAGLATPISALIPVLMILFGLGFGTRVAVIFLYGYFYLVVNTESGLKASNPSHREMARAFGCSRWGVFFKIAMPTALPLFLTALRISVTSSLKGMINAETVLAITGLGAQIIRFGRTFNIPGLYSIILLIIIIAVTATTLLSKMERSVQRGG